MSYVVSIVGRPNVGKSTLFNRLVGRKKSVVHANSGVTRDRVYGNLQWNGINFNIIDTGGYPDYHYPDKDSHDKKFLILLQTEIKKQILIAIQESDVVLFVVDITIGILDTDIIISQLLRKSNKSIVLVVNKVDKGNNMYSDTDFFRLGFVSYYCISSINGSGIGELLEKLIEIYLEKYNNKIQENQLNIPNFAIIGRPNVGKSTLINSFLEKYHNIVTPFYGTTRDSLDVFYPKNNCMLVDTPGVRKRSKLVDSLDFYSMIRTIKTIEYTDICFLLIDAMQGWESQDSYLFRVAEKNNKGIIILINKCDLLKQQNNYSFFMKNLEIFIRHKISPFYNVPILFISAKNRDGLSNIFPIAQRILEMRKKKLKTNMLNNIMLPILKKYPPPSIKHKRIYIKYCTQSTTSATPKFIFFSNYPHLIKQSYKRFTEKKIRYHFDFIGVPITILFIKNK
ncbi:ribosome biogenesis GTPase Der [Blattabacterium cuenoti]|uniref:ribosome biogenesis GTPase Der n=1 Tax=Blattabacterium cuenoti TaxID=1653831 RepID=UPI00163BF5AF|nr:ribosome biogenesis GTPase Der [Blattabacterium cuenoti]